MPKTITLPSSLEELINLAKKENPFDKISQQIRNKEKHSVVIDTYSYLFSNLEFENPEVHNLNSSGIFSEIFNYILFSINHGKQRMSKDILVDLEYLREKTTNIILIDKHKKLRETVFSLFLEHKKMSSDWNFLDKLSKEEATNIIFHSLKEKNFYQNIKSRKIDLSLYLNEDRAFNKVNLIEKSLIHFLTAHYPSSISAEKTFFGLMRDFPINIEHQHIAPLIKPQNIRRSRLVKLPKNILEELNKNTYEITVDKTNNISYLLNTSESYNLHHTMFNAESLFKYGFFYDKNNKKTTDPKLFLKEYCSETKIKEMMISYFQNKHSKSKTTRTKSIWLNLLVNLQLGETEVKPLINRRTKI